MATSKSTIGIWFDNGLYDGYARMIVWRDTFSNEEYPEYSNLRGRQLADYVQASDGKKMNRLVEVYNLGINKRKQLDAPRVYNY